MAEPRKLTDPQYDRFVDWQTKARDLTRRQLQMGALAGAEGSRKYFAPTVAAQRAMAITGLTEQPQGIDPQVAGLLKELAGLERDLAKAGVDKATADASIAKAMIDGYFKLRDRQSQEYGSTQRTQAQAYYQQAQAAAESALKLSLPTQEQMEQGNEAFSAWMGDIEAQARSRGADQPLDLFDPLYVQTIQAHAPEDPTAFRLYRDQVIEADPRFGEFLRNPDLQEVVKQAHAGNTQVWLGLQEMQPGRIKPPGLGAPVRIDEAQPIDSVLEASQLSDQAHADARAASIQQRDQALEYMEQGDREARTMGLEEPAMLGAGVRELIAGIGLTEGEQKEAGLGPSTAGDLIRDAVKQASAQRAAPRATTRGELRRQTVGTEEFQDFAQDQQLDPRSRKTWRAFKRSGRAFTGDINAEVGRRLRGEGAQLVDSEPAPAAKVPSVQEAEPQAPPPEQPAPQPKVPVPQEGPSKAELDAAGTQVLVDARGALADLRNPRAAMLQARKRRLLNFDEIGGLEDESTIVGGR